MNDESKISKIEMTGHKSGVYVVKFSKDGNHIMSGSQDRSIKLWNPHKGLLIKSYDIHSHDVLDLSISQDNSKFTSVGFDKQVYLTDSIKGNVIRRFYGHTERINTVSYNNNESIIVSGSYDCSVRIWDLKSQSSEPVQILREAKDSITKVIVTDERIISASVDGNLRVYDIRMGQLQSDKFDFTINGFDISPDCKYFVISGLNNIIHLFDNESGEIAQVYKDLHQSKNYSTTLKYTLDYNNILTTSETGDIIRYDLEGVNNKVYKAHSKIASGLDIHPFKENVFVSSGFDAKVILWNNFLL